MNDQITNVNLEEFMHDHLERSEIILLEEGGKESDDIMAVAQAKGYILKDSNDLAGFKTIYTFDTAANINKARLPKELLLKALPGIIGKPVDIDHNRIYVVGHYIDYRYVASKHMVIAYGVFYKSNFGEEWEKAKELFRAGKLGTSYEIWCPKSKRKYLPDGTYVLMNIEIAGGGLMFKEKPAFPDAKVLELAKKNMDEHTNELMFACDTKKKTYAPDEIIISGRNVYDALVQPVNKTTIPVSDRLYTADELIGKPVGIKTLPAGMKVSTQGFEKPVIGLPNPTHTQVGITPTNSPATTTAPGGATSLAEKNALQNTGLQPKVLNNDNLKDNVSVPGPQITACIKCANCAKEFNHSAQTFQRKNSIDFYEVARTDDMHQCPGCKAIVNRQGYMLHPPQVVDFGMACPSCRSSNWRILKAENPETSDVKCTNCQKQYHLTFAKEQSNKYVTRLPWLREGVSSCPQCGHSIPYSTVSTVEHKSLLCPKCNLHYGINLSKAGTTRRIERANEFVTEEENERIGDGSGGSGKERACVEKAAAKHTTPPQKFVPRSNQQIVDQMAGQNVDVDNQLTKNLKTDPNKPMNEGATDAGALYLVRHAHTNLNGKNKVRGWMNVPLDKDGKQEARELAQVFKGHAPDKIYSSDLKRALETAREISSASRVPVVHKFDLRTWNLGEHEGKDSNDVKPEVEASILKTPSKKVKGGESFNNFKARTLNIAKKLIKEANEGKQVVAVTHQKVIRLIQAWIQAGCPDDDTIDLNDFVRDDVQNGSIHKVEPTDNGVKVTQIENLQKASIDSTTSSDKEEVKMSEPNSQEVKQETPAVEAPKAETPSPIAEQPAAPVIEETLEVEDAEAVENEEALEVSKTLKAEDRNKLSNDDFAVIKTVRDKKTGGTRTIRKYPIHDKAHVQNALARLHQDPSREGLKKLGVNPDSVIEKVKAKGKKLGMETAEMEGYCVSGQGTDMQKVVKRNAQGNPGGDNREVVAAAKEKKVNKVKTGDDAVEGLTPDQVNQMQNQLFANTQKAMRYRKFQKAAMKNLKALKKAMADGVFCSVQEPDEELVKNMEIDGKKTTTVSNDNEKPTDAVTTGNAPVPSATPTVTDNDQDTKAKELADKLVPEGTGKKVDAVVSPAAPVENMEVESKGKTPTDTTSDGKAAKVDSPAPAVVATDKGNDSKVNLDANQAAEALAKQLIPTVTGDALKPGTDLTPIAQETPAAPIANAEVPGKGEETPVSTASDAHVSGPKGDGSSTELLVAMQKENESLKEKISLLETAAVKIIDRRNALGEFCKDLSDKDILDDAKFEVAKIKAENKVLKQKLNSASAHVAETGSVRGENETKRLAREINEKANRLY